MGNSHNTWMRTTVRSGSGKVMRAERKRERLASDLAYRERRDRAQEAFLAELKVPVGLGAIK